MLKRSLLLESNVCHAEEKFTIGFITSQEFNDAEILWIKEAQKDLKELENYKQLNVILYCLRIKLD